MPDRNILHKESNFHDCLYLILHDKYCYFAAYYKAFLEYQQPSLLFLNDIVLEAKTLLRHQYSY